MSDRNRLQSEIAARVYREWAGEQAGKAQVPPPYPDAEAEIWDLANASPDAEADLIRRQEAALRDAGL